MADRKIRRALISVYDKTGIVDFARALHQEFGIEIISTGGTAKLLKDNDIPVTLVEQVTGFPEMMDGRVKTLHPRIHAAILADRDNPEHMRQLADQGIEPIDMVVVNLYPFKQTVAKPDCTFEEALEMIDIGGPCLLRAAAKNHKHVLVAFNRYAYSSILTALREDSDEEFAARCGALGRAAFLVTGRYDRYVTAYLEQHQGLALGPSLGEPLFEVPSLGAGAALRYGENPHQSAELRPIPTERQRWPDEEPVVALACDQDGMSFTNYCDADAALSLCNELNWARRPGAGSQRSQPTPAVPQYNCSFIKHTNACGCGVADDPVAAYRCAYLGDPNAAMGGILAVNFPVDATFATVMMETYDRWGKDAGVGGFFVEAVIAPDIDLDAEDLIRTRKKWVSALALDRGGDVRPTR